MLEKSEKHDPLKIKIIIMGDSGVGKTKLLQAYTEELCFDEFIPTNGVDCKKVSHHVFDAPTTLFIWDAGGEENPVIRKIIPSYSEKTHGAFVCFDVNNRQSFYHVRQWISFYREHNKNGTIVLLGCKSNLQNLRCVTENEIQKLAKELELTYIDVPAKDNEKVNLAFNFMAQHLYFQIALKNRLLHINNFTQKNKMSDDELTLFTEFEALCQTLTATVTVDKIKDFFLQTKALIQKSERLFNKEHWVSSFFTNKLSPLTEFMQKNNTVIEDLAKKMYPTEFLEPHSSSNVKNGVL